MLPNITDIATESLYLNINRSFPLNIQIGITIFAVLTIVLALIGNTVVIYIVCTVNHMSSSTNTLVANMAVADLLMTIDIPYILKFFYVDHKWFGTFMGTVLCKFFHSAQVGSLIASVFSLVAISLDRSFAILFPVKTVMTKNVVRFVIAMVWLGALAFSLPVMVASKTVQLKGIDFLSCEEFWAPMSASTYSLVLLIGGYIIPLIIIAVVYSLAGIRLWIRRLPGHKNMISNRRAQSSSRRAITMFITVVIVFALSWLPFQALEILRGYNKPLFYSLPIGLRYITPWFGYANSAINPILYVIFSEYYRQEFYHILCRGPSKRDRTRKAVIEGVRGAHTEQLKRRGLHFKSKHSSRCFPADIPQDLYFHGSDLPGNTLKALERPLAVDKPLTRASAEDALPAFGMIPVSHESRGKSLAANTPMTCESSKESLVVNLPGTVLKPDESVLKANISPLCDSHERVLTVEVTPSTTESCQHCTVTIMPVDEIRVNMENTKL